jgi:hypothetical protein
MLICASDRAVNRQNYGLPLPLLKPLFLLCQEYLNVRETGFESNTSVQVVQDDKRLETYQHSNQPRDSIRARNSMAK